MKRSLIIVMSAGLMLMGGYEQAFCQNTNKKQGSDKEKILVSEGEDVGPANAAKAKAADGASDYKQRLSMLDKRYLFGVAINYADSTTYITDIAVIENMAYDLRTKTPVGLDLYTESLRDYLKGHGSVGYVCTTFLCKTMKEAEKKLVAVRKKMAKKSSTTVKSLIGFAYTRIATEQIFTNAGENQRSASGTVGEDF